ncbi:TPA: DNA polymerase I [Candidatus Uhrbacteria bacterium]|nr:DNA polymerase I [Candidatus Uhrbacteria bacterium]
MTSSSPAKTFLILDGNALLHRAWHAIPPLTTKDGRVVNAVYGFIMVIEKMLSQLKPDYMAVAWDLPGKTFRHDEYVEYKSQREKKAPELYAQIPMIQEVLKAYHLPSLSVPGFEGDDILGTIATLNKPLGIKTLIVTGDLDALQLVDDTTHVVFFVKGLSQTTLYDTAAVEARYHLRPNQLIDYKTLIGDHSDNLPGVAGIGEKSALELIQQFGTVDGIFANLETGMVPSKYAKKLTGKQDVAKQMKRLVTIVRNVPLDNFDVTQAVVQPPHLDDLIPLLQDLEFHTILKKYLPATAEPISPPPAMGELEGAVKVPAIVRAPKTSLAKLGALSDLKTEKLAILLTNKIQQDLFSTGGLASIALTDGETTFIAESPTPEVMADIVKLLSTANLIIAHDLKAIWHTFAKASVDVTSALNRPCFDTMVAAYLLSSGERAMAFADIVRETLHSELTDDVVSTLSILLTLSIALQAKLAHVGMTKLSTEIEMPLIGVLFQMEHTGIAVDSSILQELSKKFAITLANLTTKIYAAAGKEFNIQSPSQLADILYVDLAIPTKGIKKTKSGFSTAAPELEKITALHPIVALIGEYREIAKLKNTYADSLPLLVGADGRIHAEFNQCIAATGRLSSSNPNLQNIPVRSELGREIRKAFVAPAGRILVSADYSQIELRLAAVLAKDTGFITAFRDNADIHKRTAAEMWGIPEAEVTKEQRYAAKAINFGILYGIGARALARSSKVSFEEAKGFIDLYFQAHPGIRGFIDAMKAKAHADEYVETLYGRRRYLPEINGNMPQLVAMAERMAINMPAQGTQADIIKIAMRRVQDWLTTSGLTATLLLQVHDELVLEADLVDVPVVSQKVQEIMTSVITLDVPLLVDVETGTNWGDLK